VHRQLLVALAVGVVSAVAAVSTARAGGPVPWCGSGEPTADLPDAVSAFSWHLVYAVPSNGTDRFATFAPRLAGDIAAMSTWWLGQDSTRTPRFDLLDAPSCGSDYGRVDISFVRLPQPAGSDDYETIVSELKAAGFDSPDKAYLVYVDDTPHPGTQSGVCGEGATDDTAFAYSLIFIQACNQESSDDTRQLVATHELVHGLGAVSPGAPHYCDQGHVCDSSHDLMKAEISDADSLATSVLDVGRDDYYGTSDASLDTRLSQLLYWNDVTEPAPPAIVGLTATSLGDSVTVSWKTAQPTDDKFRVYGSDGSLLDESVAPQTTTVGTFGQILDLTVRSENGPGYLSAPATVRFKVGYGIVDASGALVEDTVPPQQVTGLRAKRSGTHLILRWHTVRDPIGLRGYRIAVRGLTQRIVRTTAVSLPYSAVRGRKITVQAVDEAGNSSLAAGVRVRR
jgi:hypothetical protein